MSQPKKFPASQDFMGVEQIRDGVLILRDKSLRGILFISSQNFALRSPAEQEGIIYQFQSFLNSLDFPCQIIAQSRRLNMTGYFDKLRELEQNQTNQLLKVQISEYRSFVEGLVKSGSIMTKNFYVSVPFYLMETSGISVGQKLNAELTEEGYQRAKNQLWQRMEFVALGLKRCGLQAIALNSEEIIESLWSLYHPREAEQGYYPEIPPELTN